MVSGSMQALNVAAQLGVFLSAVTPEVISVYPEPSQMNYTVNMTGTVTFECAVTGIPEPSITWFRNGTELSDADSRVTINDPSDAMSVMDGAGGMIFLVTRTLNISMSQDEDSGSYECRGSNDATPGVDVESFELIVQSKSYSVTQCAVLRNTDIPYSSS
jgi:hypothetical protein